MSAYALESSTTTINPATNESTTTTVNPATQETTVTHSNPTTQETTITKTNPTSEQTTVTKTNPITQETMTTTIVTPVPAPQEVVATPQGSTNCFMVAAGWYKNQWVSEHSVCQYAANTAEGLAWIAGHWSCTKYKVSVGACTRWEWKAGRWVKTFEVY